MSGGLSARVLPRVMRRRTRPSRSGSYPRSSARCRRRVARGAGLQSRLNKQHPAFVMKLFGITLVALALVAATPQLRAQNPTRTDYCMDCGGDPMRVLLVGAHPDDEDTNLIAWLQRGGHAATAYLSLTRGDGGQNLIGNELGEALGVIRTA